MYNTTHIPAYQRRSHRSGSAHRAAGYDRPTDVGALPENFFNSRVSLDRVCPETALMYAVLEDAFLCFHKQFEIEGRDIEQVRQAEAWFFCDESDWLFSFVSVCGALELEPESMRERLKHWSQASLDIRQAKR